MSYNGSGTFQINSAGQPVVTGTVISSTAFNALTADLATGLSTAITKDGQTTTTARITFAQGVSSTLVTDATSATTGSIITAGGISTQKALWVGTTSRLVGNVQADGLVLIGEASSTPTAGGTQRLGIAGNIKFDSGGIIEWPTVSAAAWYQYDVSGALVFQRAATEAARFGTNGTFAIGTSDTTTYAVPLVIYRGSGSTFVCGGLGGQGIAFFVNTANANGYNAAATAAGYGYVTSTGRSINAGGTINASGADYAEYMTKADGCGTIVKGDIVGVNDDGKLTDKFVDAHSFVIKSTNPSYVGGDTWGTHEKLGLENPEVKAKPDDETEDAYQARIAAFKAALEAERQNVDRIAFSGQVPVNVTGATVGDYIVPVAGPDGSIAGEAVTNPTFDQYRAAVGRVWKILEDGRAFVSVKVS